MLQRPPPRLWYRDLRLLDEEALCSFISYPKTVIIVLVSGFETTVAFLGLRFKVYYIYSDELLRMRKVLFLDS